MNPEYLENDELLYELQIRHVFELGNRRKQTAVLSKLLTSEENGCSLFPKAASTLKCDEEIALCMRKCTELRKDLKQSLETKDEGLMTRCITKTWHVTDRVKRIIPTDLYTENGLEVVSKDIDEIVLMVQKECQQPNSIKESTKEMKILEIQKSIESLTKSLDQIINEPDDFERNERNVLHDHIVSSASNAELRLNETNPFSIPHQRNLGAIRKGSIPPPNRGAITELVHIEDDADNQHGESLYNTDPIPDFVTQSSPKIPTVPRIDFSRYSADRLKEKVVPINQMGERQVRRERIIDEQQQPFSRQTPSISEDQRQRCLYNQRDQPNPAAATNCGDQRQRFDNGNRHGFDYQYQRLQYNNHQRNEVINQRAFDCQYERQQNNHNQRNEIMVPGGFDYEDPRVRNEYNERRYGGLDYGGNDYDQRRRPQQNFADRRGVLRRKPVPVHLWRIQFDGENNLNDFLSKVEMFRNFEETSDAELMSCIIYLLTKRALVWYQVHYRRFQNWEQLKRALIAEFLPSHSSYKVFQQIDSRVQGTNESFGEYLCAMQLLFSYMADPPSENHKLYLIRKNMNKAFSLAVASQEIISVDQLSSICKRMDDARDMVEARPIPKIANNFQNCKAVSFKELQEQSGEMNVLENKRKQFKSPERRTLMCWNCGKEDHTHNYCPVQQLKKFCYVCGEEGYAYNKCPKCLQSGKAKPGSPHQP